MLREIVFNNPDQDYSDTAVKKKSTGAIEAAISKDIYGIGTTGVSSAKKRAGLKMLKVNGAEPTKNNIASGRYPLFRPLYLITNPEPKREVKKFLDFALGPEGQEIISNEGTINLAEGKNLNIR